MLYLIKDISIGGYLATQPKIIMDSLFYQCLWCLTRKLNIICLLAHISMKILNKKIKWICIIFADTRVAWTQAEIKEIEEYFELNINAGVTPGRQECMRAIELSRKNNGSIQRRQWETIKKKVWNLIKKSQLWKLQNNDSKGNQ